MSFIKKRYILAFLILIFLFRVVGGCIEIGNPVYQSVIKDRCSKGVRGEGSRDSQLDKFRDKLAKNIKGVIPSPHAELILGMVLGYNDLKSIPRFNDVLTRAGTIHVVVVSGYNINLVFNYLSKIFGSNYRLRNLFILQIFAIFYALITGFEPPIVRALIMSSIFVWGSYYGRQVDVLYVYSVALLCMTIYDPRYLFDISFQLSGGATLGLIMFNEYIEALVGRVRIPSIIKADLLATISAQIFVWPLISYYFKRVSIVSFIVNPLILWTVPLITIVGIFIVFSSYISIQVTRVLWVLICPLSSVFVYINELLSKVPFAETDLAVGSTFITFYFISLILLYLILARPMSSALHVI